MAPKQPRPAQALAPAIPLSFICRNSAAASMGMPRASERRFILPAKSSMTLSSDDLFLISIPHLNAATPQFPKLGLFGLKGGGRIPPPLAVA
jgi:hypothetical protein